jgi:hypothetical protein
LRVSCVSCFVLTSGDVGNFSEFSPGFSFVDLGAARIDAFGDFDFFGLDDVSAFIIFYDLFEADRYGAVGHRHFNFDLERL